MLLTEQQKNTNYLVYLNKLEKYGCKVDKLGELYGEKLKNTSFSLEESDGYAFDGSLIYVTLNIMGKVAYNINTNVYGEGCIMHCDNVQLMKTVLLSNIGKCEMFIPQTDTYWLKKGRLYKFNDDTATTMKLGARTLYICQKSGIKLDECEYEAISSMDYEEKISRYSSPLCVTLNAVRNITSSWLRQSYLGERKTETVEI